MNNTKIKNIIASFFIYISLSFYLNINYFNILNIFIFISMFILYDKFNHLHSKKNIPLALILSILYNVGDIVIKNIYSQTNIFKVIFSFKNLIYFIGLFLLIQLIVSISTYYLENMKVNSKNNFKNNFKLFLLSFVIIIILNIPYFMNSYPGLIAPDSIYQIMQFKHIMPLTDYHPVLHTLFLKLGFKIGETFSTSENFGAACSTIIQMIIMASIYSYFIVFLNKKKINKKIIALLIILFGALPIYAFFSLSMWKDVLFGGFFLLFVIHLYNLLNTNENIKIRDYLFFIIISLLLLLFRNNAIYMYILFIPFYLFAFRKKWLHSFISIVLVVSCFLMIKHPIYNYYGVERSKSWEYLGIPIQQVGRMAYKNVNFTDEEKNKIEKFITIDNLKKDYNPTFSDGIKFSTNLNQNYFDSHNKSFLLLWKDLVLKHFDIAVESYFVSTVGYWSPNISLKAVELGVTKNSINIYNKPLLPKKISKFINGLYNFHKPVLSLQWNLGLVIWLLLLCGVSTYRINKKYFLLFIPSIGMWLTLMLATPVSGMLRYIFWAYTTLPFYVLLPSIINNKKFKK